MSATRIAFRAQQLLETGDVNAKACAEDALDCSAKGLGLAKFPGKPGLSEFDRRMAWFSAAERWAERGASHAWGFERPAGW